MTKRILALLCALAMVFALTACGSGSGGDSTAATNDETAAAPADDAAPAEAAEAPAPAGDNEVTFYYPKFYNTFDPANSNDYCYLMMYESLFAMDYGSEVNDFSSFYLNAESVTGQLAESYDWDESTGTLVVTLRDGVTFQSGKQVGYSGRALTASDVAYSYDRLLGLDGVPMAESEIDWVSTLSMLTGVSASASGEASAEADGDASDEASAEASGEAAEAPAASGAVIEADDEAGTVTFHFAEGFRSDIALTTFLTNPINIVGPEWDELTADQQTNVDYVCGTGPWVLVEYVKDSYMVFDANPDYYMTDENGVQLPYLDRVTLQYISDADQIAAQFIAGNLDWVGDKSNNVLNSTQLALVKASLDESAYVETVYAGSSPAGIGFKLDQADQPWADKNVRLALQYALDGDAIDAYLGIDGEQLFTGLWSDSLSGYQWDMDEETLASWTTYDPDYARELLAEAGYADGFAFDVVLDELQDQDLYVLVQSYWKAIGVDVSYSVAGVMAQGMIAADDTDPQQYNCYAGGFEQFMLVRMMVANGGLSSGYFYDEPEFDAAMEAYTNAQTVAEQEAAARILDEIFTTGHWCVTIGGAQSQHQLISSRIGGYHGETLYGEQHLRTMLAHLYIEE